VHPAPPEGAPNVLLVLIDDAGFGNPSTFGGAIETPNYTRMAEEGLRYNRFHVTAVCSPTRAAMLTGRNQHRVGYGLVSEFSGPFPGYNATIPRNCATLPRILQENGYMTAALGKWHSPRTTKLGRAVQSLARGSGSGISGASSAGAGQFDLDLRNQRAIGVKNSEEAVLLPRRHGGQDDRLAPSHPRAGLDYAVVRIRRDWVQPRAAPCTARVVGQVQGRLRRGLGRHA
jgi:arylsulfatase